MKARRIHIRGKTWRLVRKRPPMRENLDGLCDYALRIIFINPKAEDQVGTIIHEVLHAALPDHEEEAILEIEDALVGALEKLPQL